MSTTNPVTIPVNTDAEETVEGVWVATRSETQVKIETAEETVEGVWVAT